MQQLEKDLFVHYMYLTFIYHLTLGKENKTLDEDKLYFKFFRDVLLPTG